MSRRYQCAKTKSIIKIYEILDSLIFHMYYNLHNQQIQLLEHYSGCDVVFIGDSITRRWQEQGIRQIKNSLFILNYDLPVLNRTKSMGDCLWVFKNIQCWYWRGENPKYIVEVGIYLSIDINCTYIYIVWKMDF